MAGPFPPLVTLVLAAVTARGQRRGCHEADDPYPRAAALERIKALVLDTLPSPESKRAYGQALDDFFRWCEVEAVTEFSKATVNA